VNEETRQEMGEAAKRLILQANYTNAATVEFIVDKEGKYYFIEVNARIQVEHPVTEMVTGVDLIKSQLRIAAGEPLPFSQEDIKSTGHAIECRINAEDPARNFQPSPGRIERLIVPGGYGVRFDSHAYSGYTVPPYYDSMVGKVIAYGATRDQAIRRMRVALSEMVVQGIDTNIPLHQDLLTDTRFLRGGTSIHYLEQKLAQMAKRVPPK
jgi:acetyl-CoA carboxylase biotin carboxylase subunit